MIYYVGYFSNQENLAKRHAYLSAVNKMKYIIDVIDNLGYKQQVVSCSMSSTGNAYCKSNSKIGKNTYLHFFNTMGRKNLCTKLLDYVLMPLQLFFYLIKNVCYQDQVLVYHATSYCRTIKLAKMIKKFRLILEVEELYSDVSADTQLRKKELAICSVADAFIFPTSLLNDVVNKNNKPYIVVHGTYKVEKEIPRNSVGQREGCIRKVINCVYAGTLDPRKGGAAAAAAAAEYLPERYHIHILGFGSEQQIQDMKDLIEDISSRSKAKVTYDGLLSGEDYIRFIQSCDIGLSTQDPTAAFNATSFPSKILSYMANGLHVVSIRIPAIEMSDVGEYLYYYDKQTPQEIARSIQQVDMMDDVDGRKVISMLDERFSHELFTLLTRFEEGGR